MKAQTPITWFESIDSTNSEARRQMGTVDKLSVFAAKYQTAGRGQRGNKWSSAAGENLTFSILAPLSWDNRINVRAVDQFNITIVSALAVSELLTKYGIDNRIKWPNDIYIRNKKVCGMLIENILDRDLVGTSIIGIGINLNQTDFPPELVNPTSVLLASGVKHQPEGVLVEFMEIFHALLAQLAENEGIEKLRNNYVSRLFRLGNTEKYCDSISGTYFSGKIKGISDEGLLLMEMPDNSLRTFAFKELSYVI